jgi:hypothetical protein
MPNQQQQQQQPPSSRRGCVGVPNLGHSLSSLSTVSGLCRREPQHNSQPKSQFHSHSSCFDSALVDTSSPDSIISFQFHSISGLAPMQPATPSILYSSSPPFTPRTIPFTPCIPSRHSRPPLAFVDPQAISKKRLRAMRLFPLSLQFTPLNSYESAYCRIKRREIKKRVRQLALLREEREQLARMALDTVQCAKALFKNISHLIHSISVGEDTRDDHPSQSRKRKREAG